LIENIQKIPEVHDWLRSMDELS